MSIFISSKILLEISFGFIEPYSSPFSLLSLKKVNDFLFINFAVSLNLFFNSIFFLLSSSFFLFTNAKFSWLYLKAFPVFNK